MRPRRWRRRGGCGGHPGRPDHGVLAHPKDIRNLVRGESVPELDGDAVRRVGHHRGQRYALRVQGEDLRQRDLPFGTKGHGGRHSGGPSSLPVPRPAFWEIQLVSGRHTHGLIGQRDGHRDLTIRLLAQGAAILMGDAHRVLALLGEGRVIHEPRRHRTMALHLPQDKITGDAKHLRILPGSVGDQVMHRLVPSPYVPRIDARRHGFNTLPIAGQTQPSKVGAQRLVSIRVPEGARQLAKVLAEPPFPGIGRVGSHVPMLAWYPREPLIFMTQ
jgi:hypothetical protein